MIEALLLAVALPLAEPPPRQDREPPAAALQASASPRLALPVTVRFADSFSFDPVPLTPQAGGKARGASPVPATALSTYTLGIARRHFEDASWGTARQKGKGRELVIKRVVLLVQQGPHYQAKVEVDRYENGRRRGSATGTGHAMPDRTSDRVAAGFAPGLLGMAAAHDANSPKARKDARAIEVAVLRSLDIALLQLAAYWSSEQLSQEYREQALKDMERAKKKK